MISIYDEILKYIEPSKEFRHEISEFSDKLMNIIMDYAKEHDITVECRLVGSMAKKTSLMDKADVDIFMSFPLSYPEEKLKEYGLELGKYCINQVGGVEEIRYASHPYITGLIDEYEVDFVPCYKIKDASELKSAVDRTILHTDYIQSHMKDEETREVLLLKKFMTSVNTYGANAKVNGFSGYLCELLILKYHSFDNVVEAAAKKWFNSFKIDLEDYGTANKYNDPLIVIDPVDANRNVAAALSLQKYSEFIIACRNYLENPSDEYFNERKIRVSKEDIIREFEERATKCYVLSFNVPELSEDVIYPQINKTMNSIVNVSQRYGFNVITSSFYIKSGVAYIILEYNVDKVSNVKIHQGPHIKHVENGVNFKKKHANAYIKDDYWIAISKRKYTCVEEMMEDITKKQVNILKIGKNIKKILAEKYELTDIVELIRENDEEDLKNVFLHLHPDYPLVR